MIVTRGYRTELHLNNSQTTHCKQHAGTARFVYNWRLHRKISQYQQTKTAPSAIDLHRELNTLKPIAFPWMYQVSKCAPQEALRDLDRAFTNFFRRLKQGQKKAGFPKFKSRRTHIGGFRLTGTIKVFEDAIQLPRLGRIRLKERGYLPLKGVQVLSATVSEKAGRWYVSIQVKEDIHIPSNTGGAIGVDLGIKHLATLSNGTAIPNPRALATRVRKIRRMQRALARKKKGSANRLKTRRTLQVVHRYIANIRVDTLHKLTSMLTKTKSLIGVETLCVEGMKRNSRLARAISDVGMGEFLRQLRYKASWYGSEVVQADRFYPSSQLCSVCGHQHRELKLRDRVWRCPDCGSWHDRDMNAAVNLRDFALSHQQCCSVAGSSSETLNACERWEVQDSGLVPINETGIGQKT